MFKPSSKFLTDLTVPRQTDTYSFVDPFLLLFVFCVCLCHTVLSVSCSLVVTCCEMADFLVLLCVMFSFVIVTFTYGVLVLVWYLIVLIPDLYLLPLMGGIFHFNLNFNSL